jgi:hypothetical protein
MHPTSGPKKRYILFVPTTETKISWYVRKEFTSRILAKYPMLNKRIIWVGSGLIIKSDTKLVSVLRVEIPKISIQGIGLVSTLTSGSIKKLKLLV